MTARDETSIGKPARGGKRARAASDIADQEQPGRTKLLVVVSAWWTLTQMHDRGITFVEFIRSVLAGEDAGGGAAEELSRRLYELVAENLEAWPEAVLTPEAAQFIEALVDTIGRTQTQGPEGTE